jgi:hypothetical protein
MLSPRQTMFNLSASSHAIRNECCRHLSFRRCLHRHISDGHILQYTPRGRSRQQIQISKPLTKSRSRAAWPGSIFALTINREGNVLYGLTAPNAHFVSYSIADSKFHDFGWWRKDSFRRKVRKTR